MNRFLVAAAVGAGVFALAGAGAAALDSAGDANGQVVQQTNALTATCAGSAVSFTNDVTGADLSSLHISQQSVEHGLSAPYYSNNCDGDWVQGVAQLTNGSLAYTNKVWIPTSNISSASSFWFLPGSPPNLSQFGDAVYGEDLFPQFTGGVCAQDVVSTVLTVAGEIDGPGTDTTGAVVGANGLPSCPDASFFPAAPNAVG